MKKKTFLLVALLLSIVPFYNVKALTCSGGGLRIEYVDKNELYSKETYEITENKNLSANVIKNSYQYFCIMYGDQYEIKDGKILGLDNYCIYKDCYKDLKGKYAITAYVGTGSVEKNVLESVFAGYETRLNELIYITDVQEDNYTYNGYNFNKIDGKQIVKVNECYFDDLETECISSYDETEKMNFAKVNESGEYIYDINNLAKSIKGYKFDSYKLYIFDNFNGDGYEETSDLNVNYNCSDNLLRLYYTKVINESNETINIAEIKNIKMKS